MSQSAKTVEYVDCFSAEGHPPNNECPGYVIKQSNGEAQVMTDLWGVWITRLLPSLPHPL